MMLYACNPSTGETEELRIICYGENLAAWLKGSMRASLRQKSLVGSLLCVLLTLVFN